MQITYAKKIQRLAAQLVSLSMNVLPFNRLWAASYISYSSEVVYTLTAPFLGESQDDVDIPEVFKQYADAQEEQLREKLRTIKYALDEPATLDLVLSGGRIEKVHLSFTIGYMLL